MCRFRLRGTVRMVAVAMQLDMHVCDRDLCLPEPGVPAGGALRLREEDLHPHAAQQGGVLHWVNHQGLLLAAIGYSNDLNIHLRDALM